eukprot:CAMPEP_0118854596 /NCGR_PEP_ID=MMETSP1163-20130328/2748_1 /TAXON_ID=124430 /ORGANISM="Phaeomonas parva, Strain CCMP2877" /LENGTH=190 /DNA_ID=CAMNT_0006787347 /DNA_START=149 /DNA_END=721 /DNA_ORIENTATION=-
MARNFGELVLVLGDLHIPHRASGIPEKFQALLKAAQHVQHVICTGNLVSRDEYDELRALAPTVHVVKGDFDENANFPDQKVIQIGGFKIGIFHGHQVVPWGDVNALAQVQRQLDCDILITGHTHVNEVTEYEGKWFINPGSITGSYSATTTQVTPSFMLLAIQGSSACIYVYELKDDEVEVSKSEFSKSA